MDREFVCFANDWYAQAVRGRAWATVLCSWTGHLTLTVILSTQVYKWVPSNLVLGVALRWTSIPSGNESIFLL